MIHRFHVQNFKSIIDVSVDLSPITVLVGKSGTGKSNFVHALRFLREALWSQQAQALQQAWGQLKPATMPNATTSFEVEFSIVGIEDRFTYQLSFGEQGSMGSPLLERLNLGPKCLFHQAFEPKNHQVKWIVEPELIPVPNPGQIALGRISSISEVAIAFAALTTGIGFYAFSDKVLCGPNQGHIVQLQSTMGLDDEATNFLGPSRKS